MALEDCPVCGCTHPRCHAHKKTLITWEPCLKWPERGGTLCDVHGGRFPQQKAAAARRRAAAEIEADATALLGFDLTGDPGDPLTAIAGLAALAIAHVEQSSKRIAALVDITTWSPVHGEQMRVEFKFMTDSMDRAHKYLETLRKYAPDSEASAAKNLLTSLSEKLEGLSPSGQA